MTSVGVGKRRVHTAVGPTLTSLGLVTANTRIAASYTFDASAQTVKILADDFVRVLIVVNVTDGQVIYNPSVPTQTGSIFGDLLTFTYDTTSMSDDDELLILYEATNSGDQVFLDRILDTNEEMLTQLKIMNIHLSIITEETTLDEEDF